MRGRGRRIEMGNFLALRRTRKKAAELLRHAAHIRNMREDVMDRSSSSRLESSISGLRAAAAGRDIGKMDAAAAELDSCLTAIAPRRPHPGLRENLEVLFVAIAVAMGFRSYFLQPFKIPTGSMQPSLYGIHSVERAESDWTDLPPANVLKWATTGESHRKIAVGPTLWDRLPLKAIKYVFTKEWYRPFDGAAPLTGPYSGEPYKPHMLGFEVGPNRYWVPKDAVMRGELRAYPGQSMRVGDLLWEGTITSGDHLFVNKIAWNFRQPRRGEVAVFLTEGIPGLPPGTHYIKRMIGLPGERVSISPPDVVVNGVPVKGIKSVDRISSRSPGYDGFTLAPGGSDGILRNATDSIALPPRRYFVLGDNTMNSRDGRYWGTVPEKNLVGPALLVYWPASRRWGMVR
jgi:signal peptidase I